MKTNRFLLAACVSLAMAFSLANAQDEDKIKLAARLGYSMQMLGKGDLPDDLGIGPLGGVGGIILHFPAGPVIIAPEILLGYRQVETVSVKREPVGEVSRGLYNEQYLGIPIMVRFFPIEKLFLQAGVQVDINISGNVESREIVNLGVPMGLGYMVASNFGVDFRYTFGLDFLPYVKPYSFKSGGLSSGGLSSLNLGIIYFF